MPEVSLAEWDDFLREKPNAHFLQTGEWGELKSEFGWDVARLIVDGAGAQVLFRRLPLGLSVAYVPKPPLGPPSSAVSTSFWHELDTLCKGRHAILCKVEPDAWEAADGAPSASHTSAMAAAGASRLSPHQIQPRRTIIVDLSGSEGAILERMKPKCRYNIRLAEKKGVTVQPWEDLPAFHKMIDATGKRDAFGVHSADYYRRAFELFHPSAMCELLVATYQSQPLAALMVFARGRRAWYVYGASADAERERMPNNLLQWEAMRWARQRSCAEYDLWGVPDEDESTLEANFQTRHDGLWGVYRFKRGFGGAVMRGAQAVDRVYQPLLYQLYLRRTTAQEVP